MSRNYSLEVMRVMKQYGWPRQFALEYTMARHYHKLSHEGAIREAKRSPYIKPHEIPKGV